MLNTTVSFASPITPSASPDVLSQVLNSMRISGSLLLKEAYTSPWTVSVPSSDALNGVFKTAKNTRIAAFHLVERGHITIKLANGESSLVEAGEMVICFSGSEHTLYQGDGQQVIPFQDIMAGRENPFQPNPSSPSPYTSLVCGVFLLHDTILNPLLTTLPKLLKFSVSSPNEFPRLYGIVNLLTQEFQQQTVGNSYVIQRYLEILCAEAMRVHIENLPEQSTGWLSALKDPVIGRAIEVIHAQPAHNWSVKSLAEQVAISPSRFAARFKATLSESPMIYVTKWRMYIASQMLKDNQQSIERIANEVGYESLAAFSRAFKRHVGLPPAAWRAGASY